jgi:hypothetical protein
MKPDIQNLVATPKSKLPAGWSRRLLILMGAVLLVYLVVAMRFGFDPSPRECHISLIGEVRK